LRIRHGNKRKVTGFDVFKKFVAILID